jgi:gluconate 2-dehydrogenase gamma chain
MMDTDRSMDRREALQRVAMLLGGALSAPTIAGALSGDMRAWAATPEAQWRPRTLSGPQSELVATVAEHIIPTTDTPGARTAGVHRYIDALLTDHYPVAERDRFLAGVQGLDARARFYHKKAFTACTRREQIAMLTDMDRVAYPPRQTLAQAPQGKQPDPQAPVVGPSGRGTGSLAKGQPADAEGLSEAVRKEMRSDWFWRRMKELTLVGYYTSQPGATQELRVNPMGKWQGEIPYRTVGRSWA